MSDEQYRNKTVINQKGATIEIINSTDREDLKLSQFSGSNITLNNVVNSELATNNKQTKVVNDSFESVGKNKNTFVGKDNVERVVENTYSLKGFENDTQLAALSSWRDEMEESGIPGLFGQFIQLRAGGATLREQSPPGYAVPPVKGSETPLAAGERAANSTKNQEKAVLDNYFSSYCPVPLRQSDLDEVTAYEPVTGPKLLPPAEDTGPDSNDIFYGSGEPEDGGTGAPGVLDYGPDENAATEGGTWELNEPRQPEKLQKKLEDIQSKLNEIEQEIGNGGDEIGFIKRNKFVTIGGAVNNYPSIRVDPRGRSQPIEVAVGDRTSYTNIDFVPHVEEVNNDLNFPCGDYTLNIGNKYNVIVGSGGVQMKTSGPVEIGGTSVKVVSNKLNLMASDGMHLHSANLIELYSPKSISLRSQRQIYIDPNLGVKGNTVIGGGAYVEGELYVHHITAPVEIQQTEDTTLYGKFNCKCDRELPIGEVKVGGKWELVYALANNDLILNYPHSHHFKNIPLRMMDGNLDVRRQAQCDGINRFDIIAPAFSQHHERKPVLTFNGDGAGGSTPTGDPGEEEERGRCDVEAKENDCPEEDTLAAAVDPDDCDIRFSDSPDPNSSSSGPLDSDSVAQGSSPAGEDLPMKIPDLAARRDAARPDGSENV